MKTFSITVEDDLYELILKESLTSKSSKAEIVRRHLVDYYYANAKQEEKVVKRFEEFEKKMLEEFGGEFEKIRGMIVKSTMYELTNLHFLKFMVRDILHKDKTPEELQRVNAEYVSFAKSFALTHEVDSINSKERFDKNIKPEHLQK